MLSIITPVWNRSSLTLEFLDNLNKYSRRFDFEVIIVNNNSEDDTLDILEFMKNASNYELTIITNPANYGFGKANNIGAEMSKGDQLLFLSNDVIISGDIIVPVSENISPMCLTGARKIEFATGWNSFRELDLDIPYLEGWCIGCYKEDFFKLGGWDERYWIDYEDLDFSYNAIKKGFELKQIDLPVRHIVGQTANQLSEGRLVHTLESQKKFCKKWQLTLK